MFIILNIAPCEPLDDPMFEAKLADTIQGVPPLAVRFIAPLAAPAGNALAITKLVARGKGLATVATALVGVQPKASVATTE